MRKITFDFGEFYHVYNRGTEKRDIFLDERDFSRFVHYLFMLNDHDHANHIGRGLASTSSASLPKKFEDLREPLVDLIAYCLMPNHFHLLIRERTEGGIPAFMQRLGTAHTMFFNTKYERNGCLFQGTFKAKHVASDEYLKHLTRYIHLNPLELHFPQWKERGIKSWKQARKFLHEYQWSSYQDFLRTRNSNILDRNFLDDYFDEPTKYQEFVESWVPSDLGTAHDFG